MKWIHAINDYKDYLKIERGLSDNSIISYENDLKKEYNKPHIDGLKVVDLKKQKLKIKDIHSKLKQN